MQSNEPPVICYRITVRSQIDERWLRWFDGLEVTRLPNGDTVLSGHIVDQSALHGILNRIRDLGLELVSLHQTPCPGTLEDEA